MRKPGKEERRQAILVAATTVFAQQGVQGASMREIAAGAGLGKASLYYYYPSKEHLYAAVLQRAIDTFFAAVAVDREYEDLQALTRGFLGVYQVFFREQYEYLCLLSPLIAGAHAGRPDPEFAESYGRTRAAWIERLQRYLADSLLADQAEAYLGLLSDAVPPLMRLSLEGRCDEADARAALLCELVEARLG